MAHKWKYWLGAAAVLLVAGAGCGQTVPPQPLINSPFDLPQPEVKTDTTTETTPASTLSADEVTDAAIKGSDEDATSTLEENSDADLMNNDSSELNDYGQAYVETEFH